MKILFTSLSVAALFLLSACDKPKDPKYSLDSYTKEYFMFNQGSTWQYVLVSDTSVVEDYTSVNFVHSTANTDNNEVMVYDMQSGSLPTLQIRAEAGGETYKDRIAMLTIKNDTINVGPVVFNLHNTFSSTLGDTITQMASYNNGYKTFSDVVKIRLRQSTLYTYVYYAKNVGLIRRELKDGRIYVLRQYNVTQ